MCGWVACTILATLFGLCRPRANLFPAPILRQAGSMPRMAEWSFMSWKAARIIRPMALLMENVDVFQSHEHFRIFESFAKWAGYQLVWSQVVNAKDLTDNTRSRWLGILLRNDLDDNHPVLKAAFNLHEGFVSPWHAIENQFAIPKVLEDALIINQYLMPSYACFELLPCCKRNRCDENSTSSQVLLLRLAPRDQPLQTCLASYSTQDFLPSSTLKHQGIYADLVIDSQGRVAFQSPGMWTALLGNRINLFLPKDHEMMYQVLGNCTALPHAGLATLLAIDLLTKRDEPLPIQSLLLQMWDSRLTSKKAVFVKVDEGFAILKPKDFLMTRDVIKSDSVFHEDADCFWKVVWPNQSSSCFGVRHGTTVGELCESLGMQKHVIPLFGLWSEDLQKCFFHQDVIADKRAEVTPVFLPCNDRFECPSTVGEESITATWPESPQSEFGLSLRTVVHVVKPDGVVCDVHCALYDSIQDVAEQCGIAPEACCDFLFFDGECQREPAMLLAQLQNMHIVISKRTKRKVGESLVVEVVLLGGSSKFVQATPNCLIRDVLQVAVQPNALIDRISPSVNGKLVSLDTRVGEIEIPLIRLRAFPLPGGGKGNGKAQGKTNSSDFLQQNDPWAKIVPSNGGCRWDQLQLMENHPWFCKDTGKRLNQIPGVQLGPDKGGVVFVTKADLHELSQVAPSSTTLLLIPGFRGLQNLDVPKNLMMLASQQITVREPASNVQYKRLVVPFVLKGNVEYKVEETPGVVNVDSASFSELVVETHSGCMTHNTVAMMEDHPLGCFKKLITASGIALSEMSIYSYRKMKCADDQIIHQCMMKIPHGSLDELLKHSGQAELFVRQFIQPQEETNHSILPRYFAINPEDVRSAKLLGESVGDGYRGLALTAKGVAIRASNAKLADARALVLQTDMRFTDLNRALVSKYVFICQGYPWAISHKSLIEATFTAVKTAPIPQRSYRDGGMITWVLAFGEQPACNTFTVKMDFKLFEIVMTPQSSNKIQIPKKKSGFNGSIASVPKPWRLKSPHGKGSSGPAANATSATQINVSGDDRKYQQLADRVSKLEHGQVELSKKIDDKFDVVSDQLKQVLAAVVPKSEAHSFRARQDGHTGETPPSKSQRNQWLFIENRACFQTLPSSSMPEQIPRDPAFFGRVGNRFRAVLLVMLAAIWPLFRGHSFDKVYIQWTHLLCLAMTWVVPFLMADGRIFDTLRCFPKSWHRFMVLCVSGFFNGNSFLFVDRHRPYRVHVQVEIAVNSSPAWPPNSRCQFDSSCGFPGEGWTLSSINVGSLEKHPEALMHKTNCLAIQETRVTNYNLVKVNLEASNNSLTLHHGALMKYLPGGLPEYGGVAIASACGSSKPYDPKDDCSRIYQNLVASGRCTAAWVAVSDRLTLLVVSVYGFSGAQSDSSKMARTNQLFRDIFEWLSQHGEIPIAIAADFQAEPHMYPCIAEAMSFGAFHDVLTQFNEDGMCRPITYSRDSAWVGGPATSIDGILLNNCALQYLQDVKVHVSKGLQHAFVDATFQWPSNRSDDRSSNLQWVPHASFDLTQLKSESERTKIAQDLWEKEFRELTNDAFSAESLMTVANDFAIKILTMSGARWKHGSQKRGTFPDLKPFNRFACCQNTKDQNTKTLMAISKAICRLDDISFKISNPVMKQHAESIVVAAWKRVRTLVKSLKGPFLPIWPSQETVNEVWDFLVSARDKLVQKIRLERIQKWRQRMKVSALSNCSDIFTYLRRKNSEFGYMTVTDSHGMPFYHQDDALALAASQWNEVFEANKEHIPAEPVLEVIHDALKKRAFPISLPLLTDECLKSAVDKRKQTASPGVDGWRTAELQALPAIAFAPWARLWNKIEDGSFRLPTIFQCARLVMLPKPDAKSLMPIDKRLITLMCVPYIMWSKARFDHLQEWQQKVFPPTLCGGI